MYVCDECDKEFSDSTGAYIGKISGPMYDRIILCADCYKKKQNKENADKDCEDKT